MEKFINLFDYSLPEERIARFRSVGQQSRLMFLLNQGQPYIDSITAFYNFVQEDDLLIYNDTTVECRRVFLIHQRSQRRHEAIFLTPLENDTTCYKVLIRHSKKIRDHDVLFAEKNPNFQFVFWRDNNQQCHLKGSQTLDKTIFEQIGQMPIPPYFKREEIPEDRIVYQPVFAQSGYSVAAPTASLHFTQEGFEFLQKKCTMAPVTLNIGYGTFAQLGEENFQNQKLHSEEYLLPAATLSILQKKQYRRIIVIGTTALRVLEYLWQRCDGDFQRLTEKKLYGYIDSFYFPPYQIHSADFLLTNFHLPKSSLLMLVACLRDAQQILSCYEVAIQEKMNFFSYGDAMLVENQYKKFN